MAALPAAIGGEMNKTIRYGAFAAVVAAALVTQASAVNLNPGQSSALSGEPYMAGTLVASLVRPVHATNAVGQLVFTGTLEQWVYRRGDGNLDFVYQYMNNGPDAVTRISTTGYAGFTTYVNWDNTSTGNVNPLSAFRQANGNTISFNFDPPNEIGAGMTTFRFFIRTNAPDYTEGATQLINGGTHSVQTYAPVPEPASLAVLGIGAAALLRRRRRRKS
jgi:hypothetical protein